MLAAASPSAQDQDAASAADSDPSELDARTSRAVALARRASLSRPLSSRDSRRCDYSLEEVALPPAVGSRVASARQERGFRLHSDTLDAPEDASIDRDTTKERARAWRRDVELHVAAMLRQVRLEPETLHRLLQVVGVLMIRQQQDRDRREAKLKISSSVDEAAKLQSTAASISVKGPMVRRVLQELHRVACAMGEDVYERVRTAMHRSVTRGALSLDANAVRLESVFRLELRRQVTVDSVLERMTAADGSTLSVTRADAAATTNGVGASPVNAGPDLPRTRARSAPPVSAVRRERVTSAHAFKMRALERILDAEWGRKAAHGSADGSWRASIATADALDAEDVVLVQEKVTGFLYHRSRENFPFWREPPENALSREETARVLRSAVSALLGSPMFAAGLSIEQLLELTRVMKWRYLQRGQCLCEEGQEVHEMLVLVEGSVAFSTLSPSEPRDPDPTSPESNENLPGKAVQVELAASSGEASLDTPPVAAPMCVGELGMVRPGESWLYTLTATTAVSLLSLSRQTFEAHLLRMFAGVKPKDALALASTSPPQVTALSQASTDRPVSSPGVLIGGGRKTNAKAVASLASAASATKVSEQLERSRRHREETLRTRRSIDAAASAECSVEAFTPESGQSQCSGDNNQSDTNPAPAEESRQPTSTAKKQKIPFQYYPSFSQTDDPSAPGDVTSLFRLKWAQPIAFEMHSDLEAVRDEWTPPFPNTGAFVNYLSPFSTSAIRMLFDKPNLLSMASLHAVCRHHPFLDGAYVLGPDNKRRSNTSAFSSPAKAGPSDADDINSGDFLRPVPAASVTGDSKNAEELSLTQFSEARRKTLQGRSNSMRLRSTPSARTLMLSPTVSGRNAFLEPFEGSTFVLESSFQAGGVAARLPNRGISEQDGDNSDRDSDDSEREEVSVALGARHDRSAYRHGATTATLHATNDPASATMDASDEDAAATMARKKTLDGLLQGGSVSKRMGRLVAAEAAKQAIIQRHLQSTAGQKSPTRKPEDEPIGKGQTIPEHAVHPALDEQQVDSHAPLPLRVDLQKRMDSVLSSLRMRARAKLALVLKYTHADHYDRFPLAVMLYEQALRHVSRREEVLADLRAFEMVASDPRRHFRSLSTHRLREQKQRDALFGRLNSTTHACREALEELCARCGDELYLGDRLYRDKMQKDYTEMLFEVEQERLQAIYRDVKTGSLAGEANGASAATNEGGRDENGEDERQQGGEVLATRDVFGPSGDNGGSNSTRKAATLVQVRIPSVHREMPEASMSPCRSAVWRSMTASMEPTTNNQTDAEASTVVEGGGAAASRARFALQTPQESIYVSIGDQLLQEQGRVRVEQRRAETESSREPESTSKSSKTPLPPAKPTGVRGAMSHRMAAQVQAQRQAELEALTRKLRSSQLETPGPPKDQKPQLAAVGKDSGELRSSEGTSTGLDDESALRQLLRAFVRKNG